MIEIVFGEGWNLVRIPEDIAELEGEPPCGGYEYNMAHDGTDLVSPLGKIKSLSVGNGIIKSDTPAVPVMNKVVGWKDEAFATVAKSWVGENPARKRTRTGQYGLGETRDSAGVLQQMLGRLPTNDELMLDMIGVMGTSWAEEEEKNPSSVAAYNHK